MGGVQGDTDLEGMESPGARIHLVGEDREVDAVAVDGNNEVVAGCE